MKIRSKSIERARLHKQWNQLIQLVTSTLDSVVSACEENPECTVREIVDAVKEGLVKMPMPDELK